MMWLSTRRDNTSPLVFSSSGQSFYHLHNTIWYQCWTLCLFAIHKYKLSVHFCKSKSERRSIKLKANPNALRMRVKTRTEYSHKSEVLLCVHTELFTNENRHYHNTNIAIIIYLQNTKVSNIIKSLQHLYRNDITRQTLEKCTLFYSCYHTMSRKCCPCNTPTNTRHTNTIKWLAWDATGGTTLSMLQTVFHEEGCSYTKNRRLTSFTYSFLKPNIQWKIHMKN